MKVFGAVFKSFSYNVIGIVIGLLQLIILIIMTLTRKGTHLDIDMILMEGSILFFSSAFIVASVLDYKSNKIRYHKAFEVFFFEAIPAVVVIFVIILYCGIIGIDKRDINMEFLTNGTIICLLVAILHSTIFRAIKIYLGGKK